MFDTDSPLVLWCYCIERRAEIINLTARSNPQLQNQTPHTKLTGQPADISHLCEFGWYEWVIYRIEGQSYLHNHQKLGRVLGPTTNAGSVMSQWVLTSTGDVIPIQTLRSLTNSEYNNDSMKQQMNDFTTKIKKKLGDSLHSALNDKPEEYPEHDMDYLPYEGLYDEPSSELPNDDAYDNHDMIINAEVMLPHNGEHMQAARVVGRSKSSNGIFTGTYNEKPILDTRVFDVQFPDGSIS